MKQVLEKYLDERIVYDSKRKNDYDKKQYGSMEVQILVDLFLGVLNG